MANIEDLLLLALEGWEGEPRKQEGVTGAATLNEPTSAVVSNLVPEKLAAHFKYDVQSDEVHVVTYGNLKLPRHPADMWNDTLQKRGTWRIEGMGGRC